MISQARQPLVPRARAEDRFEDRIQRSAIRDTIRVRGEAAQVIERLAQKGILGGVPASRLDPARPELSSLIIVAATEVNTPEDMDAYAVALKEILR